MQAQSNDASICYIERNVFMAATINLESQSGLYVSPITALLRSTQLSGTCGEFLSRGPRWLDLYLTHDESGSLRLVSRLKQGCICWLMCVWPSHENRAVTFQYLSMEAVSGHTPRHPGCSAASSGASRPSICI
jgi:hypothetical protein